MKNTQAIADIRLNELQGCLGRGLRSPSASILAVIVFDRLIRVIDSCLVFTTAHHFNYHRHVPPDSDLGCFTNNADGQLKFLPLLSKNFEGARGGACVRRRGAPVPRHNGQSKPAFLMMFHDSIMMSQVHQHRSMRDVLNKEILNHFSFFERKRL